MIRKYIYIALFSVFISTSSFAGEDGQELIKSNHDHHAFFPNVLVMVGGAGLMTLGVYELGDSTEHGQQYVRLYWGTAAVASAGIMTYQFYKGREHDATVSLGLNHGIPSLYLLYRF